jgi:tetratricopeptide (TPR) repeat protein
LNEKDKYWASQVEVQRRAAAAMLAFARGNREDAVREMRAAAEFEGSMEKSPVTPGAIVPARELLADLLQEVNSPAEALIEYERTLATEPNRLRSIYGAARAAERSGDFSKARTYYQRLAALGGAAETNRPEIAEARAYVRQ